MFNPNAECCPECGMVWQYYVEEPELPDECSPHLPGLDEHSAHCRVNGRRGPFSRLVGIEYVHSMPEHYDGISEWLCSSCKTRWGRWTGKKLESGELEPRYGGAR